MPSKIQLDENLWFLYICLQKSDYKAIDFTAVGDVTNLKAPAARMRYTRLRKAIEEGTLIGTNGAPFQNGTDKTVRARQKRKRSAMTMEGAMAGSSRPQSDDTAVESPDTHDLSLETGGNSGPYGKSFNRAKQQIRTPSKESMLEEESTNSGSRGPFVDNEPNQRPIDDSRIIV